MIDLVFEKCLRSVFLSIEFHFHLRSQIRNQFSEYSVKCTFHTTPHTTSQSRFFSDILIQPSLLFVSSRTHVSEQSQRPFSNLLLAHFILFHLYCCAVVATVKEDHVYLDHKDRLAVSYILEWSKTESDLIGLLLVIQDAFSKVPIRFPRFPFLNQ